MEPFWNGRRPRVARFAGGLLCLGLIAGACDGTAGANKSEPIVIGHTTWPESIAVTYVWEGILEQRGYDVELSQRRVGTLFAEMASGDIDMFMDTWLPTTHKNYWNNYKEKELVRLTRWYEGATLELAVPEYMRITSIGELREQAGRLDGEIIGIEQGAGLTRRTKRNVLPTYKLGDEFQYVSSSTAGMLATLEGAINNDAPIVVALWHPNWAYDEFPIKDLEDPKGAFPEPESLYVTARKEFGSDHSQVARWIGNFSLGKSELRSLLRDVVQDATTPQEQRKAARCWIANHSTLVERWVDSSAGEVTRGECSR